MGLLEPVISCFDQIRTMPQGSVWTGSLKICWYQGLYRAIGSFIPSGQGSRHLKALGRLPLIPRKCYSF